MPQHVGVYTNNCHRNGAPCLHADQINVSKEGDWDYYDRSTRSYIYLKCRLNQKYYTPSLLQIEEEEKYQSGMGAATYETLDLQLVDQNGKWMTRSDDPDCYKQIPFEEPKTCSICDLVCEIRDDERYLHPDGTCPFDDPSPEPIYWKIEDYDRPCQDFLHPLLLQPLASINRRRARAAKARIWQHLREPKWMHALINSGQRITDVWKRNYKPVTFYFNSFETIVLYIQNLPDHMRHNRLLLHRIRVNLELSPSFKVNLEKGEWERRMLRRIDRIMEAESM